MSTDSLLARAREAYETACLKWEGDQAIVEAVLSLAFEEAATWHEEQAKQWAILANGELGVMEDSRVSAEHKESAAHFRAMAQEIRNHG